VGSCKESFSVVSSLAGFDCWFLNKILVWLWSFLVTMLSVLSALLLSFSNFRALPWHSHHQLAESPSTFRLMFRTLFPPLASPFSCSKCNQVKLTFATNLCHSPQEQLRSSSLPRHGLEWAAAAWQKLQLSLAG
jgi:hypothetical protein